MLRRSLALASLSPSLLVLLLACADDPASDGASSSETTVTPSESGTHDSSEAEAEAEAESETETETSGEEEGCSPETAAGLAACVDRELYLDDLQFIAQPREPGSDHWQAVQELCSDRFAEYGFEVELHEYGSGVNVVGRKLGTTAPEQQVVVAAHYDHIPGCNGADDNGTGTAATLEAARVLSQRDYPRTLIVACWDEEEWGLLGAEAYAGLASTNGAEILFNYNFEMIGYSDDAPGAQSVPAGLDLLFPEQYAQLESWEFRGDWIALIVDENGLPHAQGMAAHADALGLRYLVLDVPDDLKNSPLLADLQRSDHAAFWQVDYPAVMITDTSEFRYDQYHCASGEDAIELLDHDFARDVIAASVGGAAESLGL
ncbi:MAG: M28 family peptidase [Enhygromyxa sp.]